MSRVPPIPYEGVAELRKGRLTWSQVKYSQCVLGASNPTKPLRRCGRAQKGLSDVVAGTMCIDGTLLYMYTNIVCVMSETSDAKSASNPTKLLQRCGRGSSDLVAGKIFTVCIECTLYTNLVCVVSDTSDVESASNPLRRCGRAQGISSRKVDTPCVYRVCDKWHQVCEDEVLY